MSLQVLTFADRQFFDDNGYVVVPGAVPAAQCAALVNTIWDFLDMDPDNPSTWYPPQRRGAIVHLHQHQTLWDNRQFPRVHDAFTDILGTEKLWVSMDRAGMKPPINPDFPAYDDSGFVHWDLDTAQPLPEKLGVQGVLALTDTSAEMGGFCCVPGFHKNLSEWIAQQPADRNPRSPDLSQLPDGFAVTPIPMNQGDLVIWNRTLAHGNGRNQADQPRLAQYITMFPASDNEDYRQERVACWQNRRAPDNWEREIPAPYQGRESARSPAPATLSPLGKKLLGLDCW